MIGTAGCATPRSQGPTGPRTTGPFPPAALVTQRAVLTARGRQFTLNGYLALSGTGAQRLILTENFGSVLADVLVTSDGTVQVIRSSALFRPDWIRRYVAADLQCLANDPPDPACPVKTLSSTRHRIERHLYNLEVQTVETRPGPQPAALFEVPRTGKAAP